jgi:hypothetical protein
MAGYSGTPLPQKLGIKPESSVALVGAPPKFPIRASGKAPFDVMVVFVTVRAELAAKIDAARAKLTQAGRLWIAFPKKSSGVATDMSDHAIRDVALPTGLVDNKVCAIDETWTGIQLVIRRELRAKPPKTPRRASARSAGR